jgi:hypothetical protein
MIGSGKTTTATWVGDWLSRRGEDARAFTEFAADHPIRTRAVDQLRAAGGPAPARPRPAGNGAPPGNQDEPGGYAVSQWRRLAERCLRGRQTVILEGAFLQNSVMPAFIDDAPADTVTEAFTTIAAGGTRRAVPGVPAAKRHRSGDRAHPFHPGATVVRAEYRLRGGLPAGAPPGPARPRRRR